MNTSAHGILLPFPRPGAPVFTQPAMSRDQFAATVDQLVCLLRAQAQPCAALWFEDTALFSCALLGCWAAGMPVLLAPDLLDDTRAWARSQNALWISDQEISDAATPALRLDRLASAATPVPAAGIFQDRGGRGLFLALPPQAHAFLRTSGSSGAPSVVRKTCTQLLAEAQALIQAWSLHDLPATLLASVSHQHMYGLTFRVMVPLLAGLTPDRNQARYPETLVEQTLTHPRCIWITSPALLQRLPDTLPWQPLGPRLARVVSAGGVLADQTRAALLQRQWPLHEIYGSTETGVIATRHIEPCWTPFEDVILETDADSRLAVRSPWTDGLVQTADVIQRSDDRRFFLQGRADRILKLEDKRISLARIEQAALSHPYVDDIHCAPSPLSGRLCAMVELSADGIAAFRQHGRRHVVKALSTLLRSSVDPLAIPRHWRFPLALPRNAQSKITRQQVSDCFTTLVRSPDWSLCETEGHPDAKPASASEVLLTSRIPIDLTYFSGHFPSFPVVPGVVQLGWALEQAQARNLCSGATLQIENLKFQRFLRPADHCTMTLKWDNDKHKLYFSVRTGATMTASGRVAFSETS